MESSSSHSKISFFDHSKAENRRNRACAPDRAARDGRSKSFRTHEVFLSFRGKDTRASFTSFLRSALEDAGINIFFDDSSLPRGDDISTSLKQAIKDSQISIIVFSTNYANSRWCLDELMNIMTCHRTIGQKVLPVFYDVDPSEVRRQTGKFGNALQNLLNKFSKRERQWREVLRHAAGLAGFVVLNSRNQNEVIKDIVLKVTHLLDKTDLFIANNPVGVKSRVRDMIELLFPQPNHVVLLGMWGMGGVGKTTIAKAVYNEIGRNFEGRSFLANIREVWEKNGGVHLQEQLLCDIFKGTTTTIRSIDSGKNTLKERLKGKRVLIVLDDVNELEQLDALCGSHRWFGSGSRIIITTRDMNILRGHSVEKVFRMKEMDEKESIELFSWHAFKQASPREDFARLSSNVVEYSGRLPLALEVLGRYLFNREVTEWDCLLEKLRKVPNEKVQKKLKISYDGLDDDYQRAIFLDIACFFIGMDQNDVKHILNGCGLFAENGISVLVERSLVTVDDKNKLGMHDLLRDMGREIICGNPQKEPEERSRLWFHEDVDGVLSEKTGTKTIEGLALNLPRANAKSFNMKAFEKLEKLRLLQLSAVQLDGDFKYLSKNLRWLSWNGFPLTCLPTNFYQGNLVSIELENSNVNLIWEETPMMEKLKILNLSHSHYLTQTPDFSKLPNLEKLVLTDCPNLSEISHTIGDLSKILLINLEDCVSLRSLPRSIYKLKSLKTLILSGCSMIDKLEEDMEQMESFTTLIANNIAITMDMDVNGCGGCLLPDDSYPNWKTFSCEGSSVIFEVPQVEGCNLKTLMCVVYSSTPDNTISDGLKSILVNNYTKATIQIYKREALASLEDEEGQRVISSMEPGNKVEVVVVFGNGFVVAKTTIYLIYDGPIYEKVDECHALDKSANIVCSADENKCVVSRISPQLEPMDDFIGTASCCGLMQCSFRQWITGFMCRLVGCWGNSS